MNVHKNSFMTYNYNRLWNLLIDIGWTKTKTCVQEESSISIFAQMGENEPVAVENLTKIATVLNCVLDGTVEI